MSARRSLAWSVGAAGPLLQSDISWQDQAACAEVGGDEWFPEPGGSTRAAKRVCRGCEVIAECLDYALENGEAFGVWGGLSERKRRLIARDRVPLPRRCGRGLHVLTAEGTTGDGRCRECKQAAERRRSLGEAA